MTDDEDATGALAEFDALHPRGVDTGVQHDAHVIAWRLMRQRQLNGREQ